MKVKLKANYRFFEAEDADFFIKGDEIKELPLRCVKAYSIKQKLLSGGLQLVEDNLVMSYKYSKIAFLASDNEFAYGVEYGKFYKKKYVTGEIFFVDKEKLPKLAVALLEKEPGEYASKKKTDVKTETKSEDVKNLKVEERKEESVEKEK